MTLPRTRPERGLYTHNASLVNESVRLADDGEDFIPRALCCAYEDLSAQISPVPF